MRVVGRTPQFSHIAGLLIWLYAWAFPLLDVVHPGSAHHERAHACAGFEQEHARSLASGGPLVGNLHSRAPDGHCDICALARSVTLDCPLPAGRMPAAPSLTGGVPLRAQRAPLTHTGSLGSRAPPLA